VLLLIPTATYGKSLTILDGLSTRMVPFRSKQYSSVSEPNELHWISVMPKTQEVDLVIVGGGIGDSSMGLVMSRAGCSCVVLERTTIFPDRTRGEWFAPWDVIEARRIVIKADLRSARGHIIRRHICYEPEISREQSESELLDLSIMVGKRCFRISCLCFADLGIAEPQLDAFKKNPSPISRHRVRSDVFPVHVRDASQCPSESTAIRFETRKSI